MSDEGVIPADVSRARVSSDSGDALTLVREGELHFSNGDLDAALDSFRAAVREDAALADGYNNLAVVYWQRGDLAAALDSLSQGLTRDPRHPGLLENAARILFELGQREDAEILCKRYLDIDPGNSDMAALLLKIAAEP